MDERTREILHQRAQTIGQPIDGKNQENAYIEVVQFYIGEEKYAIESVYIREVYPIRDVTVLPNTPDYIFGIINVRRKVISVIDLKPLFDLGEHKLRDQNRAVILENHEKEFALLTDSIIGVKRILISEIQASLPTLSGLRQEYLKGITAQRLVILDGGKLLDSESLIVNEKV